MDPGFVRELNERLRAVEESILALEGLAGRTPVRQQPLQLNGHDILGVGRVVFQTPTRLSRINQIEFTPDEGDTASVDDIAEVVIPEIYKALNTLLSSIQEIQQTLSRSGMVQLL